MPPALQIVLEVVAHDLPKQLHSTRRSLGKVAIPLPSLLRDHDATRRLLAPLRIVVELRWLPYQRHDDPWPDPAARAKARGARCEASPAVAGIFCGRQEVQTA